MRFANIHHLLLIAILLCISCKAKQDEKNTHIQTADSTKINQLPKNLEEAITYFKIRWNDSIKNEFKNKPEDDAVCECHFGVGMWIRNEWLRGDRNPAFYQYFKDLGVHDLDEISSIVLVALHRRLNGKDIGLDSMVNRCKIGEKLEIERDKKIRMEALSVFNLFKKGDFIQIQMPVDGEGEERNAGIYSEDLSTEWIFDPKNDLEIHGTVVNMYLEPDNSKIYLDVRINEMNFENTMILGKSVKIGEIERFYPNSLKIKKIPLLTPPKPFVGSQDQDNKR